jgi:hypothetical protein
MPAKPGIRTRKRSAPKAKAELRLIVPKPLQNQSAPAANWFKRILALLMRKTLGRG